MLTKHYLQRAFMNHRQDESFLTDLVAIPLQISYMLTWDFWHVNSVVSSLDSGKIGLQNYFYYRKHKMTFKDRKKASKITLKIYEAMIKSNLYTNVSKDKQYYSYLYDRYFEYADLPRVFVCIHQDAKLKNQQEIRISFDANQAKAIESDQYMTILNQCLASVDDNLTVSSLTIEKSCYVYKLKDDSLNYRINLANFKPNFQDNLTVWLDGGHKWKLDRQYGAILEGSSGTGKTSLLFGILYQLMLINKSASLNKSKHANKVLIYVADGKNDTLGAVMKQVLPNGHVATGIETAELVHKMVQKSDKRYEIMSKKRKKNPRLAFADFKQFGFNLTVILIDEQSAVMASLPSSQAKKQYQNDLLKLVQTSRGAGIIPIISMQQANAISFGGQLGTAIREQLNGLKIVMGTTNSITTQDKQMIFGSSVELPISKFDGIGSGYLQTSDMQAPEAFQAPLLPADSEELYKLLQQK